MQISHLRRNAPKIICPIKDSPGITLKFKGIAFFGYFFAFIQICESWEFF
jgi:hypothetical protein